MCSFGYVLFEWDSYLVTYMLTLLEHPLAKWVAVSTYLQITKARTVNSDGLGFVPNFAVAPLPAETGASRPSPRSRSPACWMCTAGRTGTCSGWCLSATRT